MSNNRSSSPRISLYTPLHSSVPEEKPLSVLSTTMRFLFPGKRILFFRGEFYFPERSPQLSSTYQLSISVRSVSAGSKLIETEWKDTTDGGDVPR